MFIEFYFGEDQSPIMLNSKSIIAFENFEDPNEEEKGLHTGVIAQLVSPIRTGESGSEDFITESDVVLHPYSYEALIKILESGKSVFRLPKNRLD